MQLRDYLHFKRIKCTTFAKQIDIHPHYVRQIARGTREPGLELAVKISNATNGEVKIKDLKPNYEPPISWE